jgi:GntR family transcriptional regulator
MVRVRLLDDVPVMVEHAAYPEHIGALLIDADLETGSVYAALAEHGVEVASGHHRISAVAAEAGDAELLRSRPGTPLLRQERTVFAGDGTPIEHSDDRWRGDSIVLDAVNSVQGSQLARRAPD